MSRARSDRPSAIMRVTSRPSLEPASAYDAEVLSRYAPGAEVEVELRQARDDATDKLRRLYWSVLGKVVDNTDFLETTDLHDHLKTLCGLVNGYSLIGGGMRVEPTPKSLRSLDGAEMSRYFDAAMNKIAEVVIPGFDIWRLVDECRAKGRRAA